VAGQLSKINTTNQGGEDENLFKNED